MYINYSNCMKCTSKHHGNLFLISIVFIILTMLFVGWNQKKIVYFLRADNFMLPNSNVIAEGFGTKRQHDQGGKAVADAGSQAVGLPGASEEGSLSQDSAEVNTSIPIFSTLLSSIFPVKKDLALKSDKDESQIWWHYPTFRVGSYAQITNNLKYMNNPDIARCTPDDFCGVFYHKRIQPNSNYVYPLPPVPLSNPTQTRVNYFTTNRF